MSPSRATATAGPDRPSRPATPGSGGPDRRPPVRRARSLAWELWNFRALFPEAGVAQMLAVRREQEAILAREREALARLWSGDEGLLSPGRTFLATRPGLAAGIVVSLHTGPYQLLPEPWLAAGLEPLVLLNRQALPRFRDVAGALGRRLGHRGDARWAAVGEPGFMRAVVSAVRGGRPVLAYLDGNSGDDGTAGTRDHGQRYALPGREILVRNGLARLSARLDCPLHRVALRWDDGRVVWEDAPSLVVGRGGDPVAATRELFDWAIARIRARPAQWQYWTMLRDSSACFAAARLESPSLPPALAADTRQAFAACCAHTPRTVRLVLEHDVAVWPGDVLADLTTERFFPAAGLCDADLDPLRAARPTLHELAAHHGEAWLRFHGLRLLLLGVARLGA